MTVATQSRRSITHDLWSWNHFLGRILSWSLINVAGLYDLRVFLFWHCWKKSKAHSVNFHCSLRLVMFAELSTLWSRKILRLTDFVCLLIYEFCLSLWKIARCSVILLLPLFINFRNLDSNRTTAHAYGVYFSQITRYARVCSFTTSSSLEYFKLWVNNIKSCLIFQNIFPKMKSIA